MQYEDKLRAVAEELNLEIRSIKQISNDLIELTLAHKNSIESVDLETVSEAANAFAEAVDYEIGFDVSSEGAERVLEPEAYALGLGKHVHVALINPTKGYDYLEGTFVSEDADSVTLSVRVKHTSKNIQVERNNIRLLRLAVKL